MKHRLYIATILLYIGTFNAIAQLDRSKAPLPGPAPSVNIAEYQSFTLPNGLTVFVVESHKVPRVSFSFKFNYTPIMEGEYAGYVDIAGNLVGTATTTKTKDKIDEKVDFLAASLSTGAGYVSASSLKKHTDKLLTLVADVLLNPLFSQDELDKLRQQKLSELMESQSNPRNLSAILSNAVFYGKTHPYGTVVSEENLKNITVEKCKEYYDTYYRPNIAYLSIVGDITVDEAKKLVTKYFSKWESKSVPAKTYPVPDAPKGNTVVVFDYPASVQSVIKLGYPLSYNPGNPDYIKAYVMNTLLGGGVFRLFDNLREVHGYTYGAYSSLSSNEFAGKFIVNTNTRNALTDSCVYEILYEMRRIRTEKVGIEELTRVRNNVMGNFALALEDPSTIASFAMNIEKYKLPKDYYANFLKNVAAVSTDDIQQMALKYIKPDNSYIFVVGKASDIADKLKPFSMENTVQFIDVKGNYIKQ